MSLRMEVYYYGFGVVMVTFDGDFVFLGQKKLDYSVEDLVTARWFDRGFA